MDDSISPPVTAAINAANAGNTDEFLALFDENGFVDDWGRIFEAHDQIKRWSDSEFIGVAVHLAVISHSVSGAVTVIEAQVGGDGFNGASHFSFEVVGNRLHSMKIRA